MKELLISNTSCSYHRIYCICTDDVLVSSTLLSRFITRDKKAVSISQRQQIRKTLQARLKKTHHAY